MKESLRELYKYRELLFMMSYRDIKIKYKQSVMGLLWAVLMPVLIVTSGILVKYAYSMISGTALSMNDVAGVAVKSIPWAFLVASIRFGCMSLIGNNNLVTKIYFPKEIFPISAVVSQLFDFMIASSMLVILLLVAGTAASVQLVWVPLLIVTLVMLALGVSIAVSAASLFFRDVKYIVEVFLTFGIFFTPVFYDVTMLGKKGQILLLNPAAPIVEGFRACIVQQQPPNVPWLLYSLGFSTAILVGGYIFFKSLEPAFAESI